MGCAEDLLDVMHGATPHMSEGVVECASERWACGGGGHIIIVLNECVAQMGESQVIKERNTTSECGGRAGPLGFDVVCRV